MSIASRRDQDPEAPATVLARVVARILDLAVESGLDRGLLVEATGLGRVDLTSGESRVPYSDVAALWEIAARHANEPDVGLRWAARARARDWGLLGYAMSFSATLGDALRRLERYCRILTDSAEFKLEWSAGRHVNAIDAGSTPKCRYSIDYRLGSVLTISRAISGADIVPIEATFSYDQPSSILEHRRLFRCPLRFAQPRSQVVLQARDLETGIPRADETLAGYLTDHAETVIRSLLGGTSVRDRVRTVIWSVLSGGRPTLTQVAAALHLPPRTLQRHLAAEGTSLQQEVDDIRKSVAIAALKDRRHSVEEVAFLLGYNEPSTFFRSFRRWTGTTPRHYRSAA
jgi:AraC-like DNA-binding protein